MNSLKIAYRRLFLKGQHTTTRIISLAAGLAFSILLLSEVFYYFSFDSFYPNANRIYSVQENFKMDNSSDKMNSHPYVSGAIAPGLKEEVSGIEAACRFNSIGEHVFYTNEKKSYECKVSLADEYVFDVLPRPMINGNPKEILTSPMNCMVSDKIAEEMGGDVVGEIIELKRFPGKKLTIAGIFKALPENTNYEYDVLISMTSTNQFTWDGTNNWMGNDRYYACVRLMPGINPESLAPAVREMQVKHQDIETMERKNNMTFKYSFKPIKRIYSENKKDMIIILSTIAFAVLFVSLLNYILLTLSVLANRARISAIHKTCGAQSKNLHQLIFSETFLLFGISVIGAILIMFALKPIAENQLEHSLSSALTPNVIWPVSLIIISVIIATAYFPGRFFSRIPVATAFKNFTQKKNNWKLALLSFQFIGASFILTVMIVVTLQYNNMKNANHGYNPKGVYFGSTSGMDGSKISTILNELRSMPEIKNVGLGYSVPTDGASGNNIKSPDGKRDLFNIADFYEIDENYLSVLDIPIDLGQRFSPENAATNDVMLSKKGAEMLILNNGWSDGVVGKQISVSEHGSTTIQGIFPDFIINSISNPDSRPSAYFFLPENKFIESKIEDPSMSFNILVKVHENSEAGIRKKISEIFNLAMPQNDATVKSLEEELQKNYASEKGFRNAMMAGNFVILLITIIGLLGYTTNEANRRRKELAIRRISGANLANLLKVFITDLEIIAIPAITIGLTGAWFTANRWMQNFATKITLSWQIFILCSIFILVLVAIIAAINYVKAANKNPVEALRYE